MIESGTHWFLGLETQKIDIWLDNSKKSSPITVLVIILRPCLTWESHCSCGRESSKCRHCSRNTARNGSDISCTCNRNLNSVKETFKYLVDIYSKPQKKIFHLHTMRNLLVLIKQESFRLLPSYSRNRPLPSIISTSAPGKLLKTISLKRDYFGIFSFYVRYSTQLHLPPLRFHCVGGCWDRTQDSCDYGIGWQTL